MSQIQGFSHSVVVGQKPDFWGIREEKVRMLPEQLPSNRGTATAGAAH
jgi:hypothetical protein